MFRYIAIIWDAAQPDRGALAEHLGKGWLTREHWTPVLLRPGLQVFTTGTQPGINEAHTLPGGQGVVLGKLFRRSDLALTPARHAPITAKEGSSILESGSRILVDDYWGRYVAFTQTASGTVTVLRDPSGTLPCFFTQNEGVTVTFSWLGDALELLGEHAPRRVNWDALLVLLQRGSLTGRNTALDGLLQVLPGERLDFHDGSSTLLWNPISIARSPAPHTAEEATKVMKQHVQACARSWASCYDTVLLRLSGGVDSSILLSCLMPEATSADVIGINYHSVGSDSDERHYARLAAARAGRDLIERERDAGFRIDRIQTIARMPEPVHYIGWMNAATDAALARAYGAPALFTGAGGDSLFYEFPRWWPAADYLRIRGLDTGFIAAAMDAARLGKTSVWRTMALAFKERLRPSLSESASMGQAALLAPDLASSTDPHRFAHPALCKPAELPIGKYMQTIALMQPLGYYDPFEQAGAPELVNPLLSQPLVELCLRWPTYLLAQGGRGRALARRAYAKDLPPQIVNRRSKGGLEEHVRAVLLSNIDFVRETLLEGQLAARRIIDRPRLEALLSGRPTALAGSNSQIHALVATEAWISRWSR